jgi:nitronate monooxygenase
MNFKYPFITRPRIFPASLKKFNMKWENELTKALGLKYPIVQAPMLGVTTPEMVAAISNQGGLGSLPVGGLSPEKTIGLIQKTKSLTQSPFAVNLFSNTLPQQPIKIITERMQDFLNKICIENGLDCEPLSFDSLQFHSYINQIDCLLRENIAAVSFTFGSLDATSIKSLKQQGTVLIGTATCLEEAQVLDEIGIDIITAQGIEAGGHRGTFLNTPALPMIGLMSLIPQIASKISKPVIAAGGISDGRSIDAAFTLGAKGVQIGTAFIASDESAAIPAYKEALRNAEDCDTVLTKTFSGRWARGLKNKFITALENSGLEIPGYPIQGNLTLPMRIAAQRQNNREFTSLWAGQSAYRSEMKSAAAIFSQLVAEANSME